VKVVGPRLTLRIYLVGLAQCALVLVGFALLMWMNRAAARNLESDARAAVERIVAGLGDPAEVARELQRIEHVLDASVVIHDGNGQILATNRRVGDIEPPPFAGRPVHVPGARMLVHSAFGGPLPPPHFGGPLLGSRGRPPMLAFMMPVELPGGSTGRAFYAARNPRSSGNGYLVIAFVLGVVGLTAFFTARSLAKPLTRLSVAAQRFGAGELETRVRLQRVDEIGDVARAFDEMAERIAQLVRREKELIANVSHELRTPLARIRVALDLAAEGDASVARQSLGEITEDVGELEQLVSDVLVASRLDFARLRGEAASEVVALHRARVDVDEVLGKAAARFRAVHPDRPLRVETLERGIAVDGDPVLLRRALENLLENAHKYTTEPDGSVVMSSGVEGAFVWIAIRDQGSGIAPDDLRHVFLPFFRSDKSRTRATGGFGLGLAIVKQIAEAHQGSVDIESQLGAGTRVRVRLPLATTQGRAR
jgi:two-component system, OmpR family, sensor kinase